MEIDDSGWSDIERRLAASTADPADLLALVDHVADRLVAHFGAEVIECWLGKDGRRRHAVREVAAASVAHLIPVLEATPETTVRSLVDAGAIGGTTPPPWDESWRANPRTAGWRS